MHTYTRTDTHTKGLASLSVCTSVCLFAEAVWLFACLSLNGAWQLTLILSSCYTAAHSHTHTQTNKQTHSLVVQLGFGRCGVPSLWARLNNIY